MGTDVVEVVHVPQNSSHVKAHGSVCSELSKILDKMIGVLPAIESARPGWTAGIQELCSLNNTIQKAKLLIQHCSESSKLYLAITGESVILRCERIRSSLTQSLCLVQNMVPQMLVEQISVVLDCLRDARFTVDSSEDKAGKAILELLAQTNSSEELEFEAFQIAVSSLKITSPKALLIERRSIKKLLDKIQGGDPKKERILKYFLFLIKKYGKKVKAENTEQKEGNNSQDKQLVSSLSSTSNDDNLGRNDESNNHEEVQTDSVVCDVPPEEFCCPISLRLMYDPVVIASGQTYERISIEKWFNEGHDTCPKTQKKLEHLNMISNSCMKVLISNWCEEHDINLEDPSAHIQPWEPSHCSSISSLKNVSSALLDGTSRDFMLQSDHSCVSIVSSIANHDSLLFSWSDDYLTCQSFSNFSYEMYLKFFYQLSELPPDLRDKGVEDIKILLEGDEEMCYAMLSNGFAEALMDFLRNAYNVSDVHAQKTGARVFLAFLSNNRVEIPTLTEDAFQLLTYFLASETTLEALMILQKLSPYSNSKPIPPVPGLLPSIVKLLDCKDHEFQELAIKILSDLSLSRELKCQIVSFECISKLVPFFSDQRFGMFCLKILENLSDIKESLVLIAETDGCIASIAEFLEIGSREEQAHAVSIFHSLCSQSLDYCFLVMKEGIIPSLVDISVNGNSKGKENSMKLLHLLKDLRLSGSFETSDSDPHSLPISELKLEDSVDHCDIKQLNSKSSGFFGRKVRSFLKLRSVALS